MRERYIPALIMLIAGAITSIYSIINKIELVISLERLLLILIIFYFIGLIVKAIFKRALMKVTKTEEEAENKEVEKQPEEKK